MNRQTPAQYLVAAMLAIAATAIPSVPEAQTPQPRTVYQPAADDPRIMAAMAARQRLEMAGNDVAAIEVLFAPDLVVHSPINMVVSRENVLARMRSGEISYEEGGKVVIEFVGVRGGSVVIMGEEILTPNRNAPNAGKTIHRRFTDIWTQVGGAWKLSVRQATVTSVQ